MKIYLAKQNFYLGLCLVLALPTVAQAFCFERFYSLEHLEKHKKQVVKSLLLDFEEIYDQNSEDTAKAKLQIRMLDKINPQVIATANAICKFRPNSNRTEGDCKITSPGQGAFTFKANGSWLYDSESMLVNLSEDSILENSTYSMQGMAPWQNTQIIFSTSANGAPTVKVPKYDHSMRIDKNLMVSAIKGRCEPIMFMAGVLNPARFWNEVILYSIRNDLARPTVTARNLFHLSALLWDVHTSFEADPNPLFLISNPPQTNNPTLARDIAMAYAAKDFLMERYKNAPVNTGDQYPMNDGMETDGLPDRFLDQTYNRLLKLLDFNPKINGAAISYGQNFAKQYIALHLNDGSREAENYRPKPGFVLNNPLIADISQSGLRSPMAVEPNDLLTEYYNFLSTLPEIEDYSKAPLLFNTDAFRGVDIANSIDINHWLRLNIPGAIDQGGTATASEQSPLTLFWGGVKTFSDLSKYQSPNKPGVYFDPGHKLPKFETETDQFIKANLQVIEYSALLNPLDTSNFDWDEDGLKDINPGFEMFDISPARLGNNSLGQNNGQGHPLNPITGLKYQPNFVKKADYYRSIAEFWADGPESETPPGHWNSIANYVLDQMKHQGLAYRWLGQGEALDDQEYTLKTYLTLNGALHDAAIAAWGLKGYYQGNRPVTVLRKFAAMAENDPAFAKKLESLSPNVKMVAYTTKIKDLNGKTQTITKNKLAIKAWRGARLGQYYQSEGPGPELRDMSFRYRNQTSEAEEEFYASQGVAGVGWILAENWTPYQRSTFVTPPFPGFVSGHSTFSRAAAEVLAGVTGSAFFPGGLGRYQAPDLHFEYDDNKPFEFQWATYFDAADVSGLSRIYGGIHATYDDLPAREVGSKVGQEALKTAEQFFNN